MAVIILILALILLSGCSNAPKEYILTDSEYERLTGLDGPMFEFGYHTGGMVDSYDDYWATTYYTVYSDGTIEKSINYNISGSFTSTETLSKEDYFTIYEYCRNWMQSDKNGTIKPGGFDCDSYNFFFYDEDGTKTNLYRAEVTPGDFASITDICKNYNRNIEVNLVFNIYEYASPGYEYVIKPYYPGSDTFDCKAQCPKSGDILFDMIDIEGMEWKVYVLPEEPMEEDYDRIAAEEEPAADLEKVSVVEGDWILVYPVYTGPGEGFPENAYAWGYYRN